MSSEFTELCVKYYGLSPANPEAIDIIINDCFGIARDNFFDWEIFEELCYELGIDPKEKDAYELLSAELNDPEDDEDDSYDYNY